MPEGPEVETENLREAIQEEMEKEGGSFLKQIALTTALLAVCAAIASLRAGATVNEALVLKTEATRLQAEASDQWAYYQAKGLKAAVQEASATPWLATGREAPAKYAEEQKRYKDEQSKEADHLLHEHHGFANTVALFQVSIALGAVAALTRNRLVWFGSMGVGLIGLGSSRRRSWAESRRPRGGGGNPRP